jgi:type II secretory pathway pseudopilin PulG
VATVLVLATVPAMIASFGGSVIATILASMPVVVGCFAYLSLAVPLARFLPLKSVKRAELLAALFVALLLATALLAAWRMWIQAERTWRNSLRTAAALAGLLAAYLAVPVAAAYLYVTLFAPLSFFLGGASAFMSWNPPLSPGGKYVTFDTSYSGWGQGTRAACVDVDSGRTRWLTLFRDSFVWPVSAFWSPSGDQFVLEENSQWLWPWARETAKPMMRTYSVVDARSGEKRSFCELCPGLPRMPSGVVPLRGWYSEQVFAFQNGRDIFFADIESHQVRQCKMPVASPVPFFGVLPSNTRRGIFAPVKGIPAEGEVRVLRYSPELAEAESITLYGVIRGIQSVMMSASEDGQWLLLSAYVNDHGKWSSYQYLAQSADGAKAALFVSAEAGEKGLIAPSWKLNGFVPGGHQVLLYREAELGLFDAASHDLRRIPMAQASGMEIASVELSPAGGFVLVHCENPRTAPEPGLTRKDFIVDLHNGTSSTIDVANQPWKQRLRWMGEDHWLLEIYGWMPRVINRDGTGDRPLLAD